MIDTFARLWPGSAESRPVRLWAAHRARRGAIVASDGPVGGPDSSDTNQIGASRRRAGGRASRRQFGPQCLGRQQGRPRLPCAPAGPGGAAPTWTDQGRVTIISRVNATCSPLSISGSQAQLWRRRRARVCRQSDAAQCSAHCVH